MKRAWNYLEENDVVDLVAPGYPVTAAEIAGAVKFIEGWNLQARLPKKTIQKHFLHANEDDLRFEFLKKALLAPDSKVVWCLRGGYGSNRLLPYLQKIKKPTTKKLLVGISDISSLHTFLTQEWGWVTLHGPLLDRMGKGLVSQKHVKEMKELLFGDRQEVEFTKLKPLNPAACKNQIIKGAVTGGNLTVLQSTLGTPWQVDTKNKFLFIEDLGERGYRVDRMLEQFRQAGLFKNCRGLILGDFFGGQEPGELGIDKTAKVFQRWAGDLEIPVFKGLEAGHGLIQRPVPFNTDTLLTVSDKKVSLKILTGGF